MMAVNEYFVLTGQEIWNLSQDTRFSMKLVNFRKRSFLNQVSVYLIAKPKVVSSKNLIEKNRCLGSLYRVNKKMYPF